MAAALTALLGAGWAFLVAGALVLDGTEILEYGNALLLFIAAGGLLGWLLILSIVRVLPVQATDRTDSLAIGDIAAGEPQIISESDRRWADPRRWPASFTAVLTVGVAIAAVAYPLASMPSLGVVMERLGPRPDLPEWVSGPDPMDLWSPAGGLRAPEHPFAAPSHFVLTVMASGGSPSHVDCLVEAFDSATASMAWVEHIATEELGEDTAGALVADAFEDPAGDPIARAWIAELVELSAPGDGCLNGEVFAATFGRAIPTDPSTGFTHLVVGEMVLEEPLWGGVALLPGARLDCQGELVGGMGAGAGVLIIGATDVTVTDCAIQNFEKGVLVRDSEDVRLSGLTVRGSLVGVVIQNANRVSLADSGVFNARTGISVSTGTGPIEIRDTEITASLAGIRVSSVSDVLLTGLHVVAEDDGILVAMGARNVTVASSEIEQATRGIAVLAQGSDTGITLEENVLANTRLAIAVLGSTQVTATGNVCTDAANPSVTDGLCQGAG